MNGALDFMLAGVAGARAALVARARESACVLSVADEGFSVIAGAVCSRLACVPHVVAVFDLWEENGYTEFERMVAHFFEPRVFRSAAKVIVHCPQMAEHYRDKYGIEPAVVLTATEVVRGAEAEGGRSREILFGGAVYWAQEDAVRRLSEAVGQVSQAELTIIGRWAEVGMLARRGIHPHHVEPELEPNAYARRIREASVLFVGLSFGTRYPEIIKTAAPAKLPEYMASGVPILVHAPRGSYVAEYARKWGFAVVVDSPDVDALARAIRQLLADDTLRETLVTRAWEVVTRHHTVEAVRDCFEHVLAGVVGVKAK